MKVAIVHEWLDTYAGSERVLEQLIAEWPDADLFAVCDFLPEKERGFLRGKPVTTTFIQRLNTSGGVMPSSGCALPTDVGKKAFMPYTADYFFYEAD